MTFKQALEFDAHVRKGEHGSLVVYANSIIRTETGEIVADQKGRLDDDALGSQNSDRVADGVR